jgi:hypothetical protein
MPSLISPTGDIIRRRTVKELIQVTGFRESNLRSLLCAHFKRFCGWCSTHPRARKARERFTTTLVNTKTGERAILGQTVTGFAKRHGLCKNELYRLVNYRSIIYRGWMMEKTYNLTHATAGVRPLENVSSRLS